MTGTGWDAASFAAGAHAGQTYGPDPYISHVSDVVGWALLMSTSGSRWRVVPEEWAGLVERCAYLHDVVEDTPVTLRDIRQLFGHITGEVVGLVTDDEGPNRKARKAATYQRFTAYPEGKAKMVARVVKFADRLANIESARESRPDLWQMYRKESDEFLFVYLPDNRADWQVVIGEYRKMLFGAPD